MSNEIPKDNTEILNENVVQKSEKQLNRKESDDQDTGHQFSERDRIQYDELLSSAGVFGLYQCLLLLAMGPFYMFGIYTYYSQMFITEVSPNHWCWIPELAHLTDIERRNLAIPNDDSMFGYSRCTAYVANWTEIIQTGQVPDDTWEMEPCQHGWEFNSTEIPYPTISSELGWVCDRGNNQARAQSLFSVGAIVGCLIFGWVADRYGRIPAAVFSNLLGFIGGFSSSFTNNFIQFTICRFIMGMAYDTNLVMVYVLVLEYISPKYRSLMSNVAFAVFYCLFLTTLPFIVLALGHWKWIAIFTSAPLALAIFTPLLIPESPRWLLSKGRVDEAIEKVLMIGRINKKTVPPKLIEQFKWSMSTAEKEENHSIISVFRRPILRKVLFLICLMYMCSNIVFDGLLRNIGNLDFDFFVTFALLSATELPSMLLLAAVLDFLGRRWLVAIVLTMSTIFTFLTIFASTGLQSVIFVVIARFGVNMSYGAIMQWAAELFPTAVRGSSVAFVHICGFVAFAISPYIVLLNNYAFWLPLMVIGIVGLLGSILPLFLPETAKKEMPHSFEDADQLMTSQQFCEMPCIRKRDKASHTEIEDTEEYVNQTFERD